MTLLDQDLRADGGARPGIPCPECDWRFLQEHALETHRAVTHDAGDPWHGQEVVAGD